MIEIGSALDLGLKRNASKNQDALRIIRPDISNSRPPLLILADGMGGYQGGAVASQLVIDSFGEVYLNSQDGAAPIHLLQAGVTAALQAMKQHAVQDPFLDRMGSTVVAAVLKGPHVFLINVGDSRAYLVNAQQIRQISYDHSLVGEQMRLGMISAAQVRYQPRRNVLSMSISAQRESVETYTGVFEWRPGDHLVLCSDGLWGPVTESQIQSVVLQNAPQQAAQRLVELANANQGPDNISVIVARYI